MECEEVIVISDLGEDPDDEFNLIVAAGLARRGLIKIRAVVANLVPSLERALLGKGMLKVLGFGDVPVGVGSNCGGESFVPYNSCFDDVPYLADPSEVRSGLEVLTEALENCDDGQATLLLISSLTDATELLKRRQRLFVRKVKHVVIMAGVRQRNSRPWLTRRGFLVPDSAANNNFDPPAARYLLSRLQELSVPLTILSRHAVYPCAVPRGIYDQLLKSGNPIGAKLHRSHVTYFNGLWGLCHLPHGHEDRSHLPERINATWFRDRFLEGKGSDRRPDEPIVDLVTRVNLYDPMALLACVPELCARYYAPLEFTVRGATQRIIGAGPDHSCAVIPHRKGDCRCRVAAQLHTKSV